jgi:hypothetical protein
MVRQPSAAFDLGLTAESRAEYLERLDLMFREACIMFGPTESARLFRARAKTAPKPVRGKRASPPPRKQKGAHDPIADKMLVQLWMNGSWRDKHDFARSALKNHSASIRKRVVGKVTGKNLDQDEREVKSLIRRLDRALQRRPLSVRQIGKRKLKS